MRDLVFTALIFVLAPPYRVFGDKFCGVDDADETCWQPCSSDGDCCSPVHRCIEASSCGSSVLSGTNHNFCGVSWCDAAYKCGTACPEQTECPDGEFCFADIPCDSDAPETPPILPDPPTTAPNQFCGNSISNARDHCWQPCPRGDSDCCLGLSCFDTSSQEVEAGDTCSSNGYSGTDHYYCGSSWCQAAYSCSDACSGGTNEECPEGTYCYADVPCTTSTQPPEIEPPLQDSPFTSYCGVDENDAGVNCWQPCRDDADCCMNQECYAVSTCTYPDFIGADHYFCGTDFCDASMCSSQPCPSGFDAQCPEGQRCVHNTPCNANMRLATTRTLQYGLPVSLARNYDPGQESQTNAAPATIASKGICSSFVFVSLFTICLNGLVV